MLEYFRTPSDIEGLTNKIDILITELWETIGKLSEQELNQTFSEAEKIPEKLYYKKINTQNPEEITDLVKQIKQIFSEARDYLKQDHEQHERLSGIIAKADSEIRTLKLNKIVPFLREFNNQISSTKFNYNG